jgi:hypothetical protein
MHQGFAKVSSMDAPSNTATNNDNDNHTIPSILIITRPQVKIDYPLWQEARDVWKNHQPSVEQLMDELILAGFTRVHYTVEAYPCQIPLHRWLSMIRNRFWSTFSNFSDTELEQACERIKHEEKHRVDDEGVIRFDDRLIFLTAYAS